MENQILTNDVLRQTLIVHLASRRLESHKEMVEFLIRWLGDANESAFYDGNSIKPLPESSKDENLYDHGYKPLVSSFNKMDLVEKLVLRAYFYNYEIERAKQTIKKHLVDELIFNNK